jgi:hypothetical protein
MWSSAVCERLAELRPSRHAGWEAATLGAALRPPGITTAQTWWTLPAGRANSTNPAAERTRRAAQRPSCQRDVGAYCARTSSVGVEVGGGDPT